MHLSDFPHIVDGEKVAAPIVQLKCPARMTVFVPEDETIKKAMVVFPHNEAHNHPVPALNKATEDVKVAYNRVLESHNVLSATVTKIDDCKY